MNIKIISIVCSILALVSCDQGNTEHKTFNQPDNAVHPPLKDVDVPFKEYNVEAGKDDTLFYQTGSIILLPRNAFVDKNGKIIEGTVHIKYREFSSPIDFYLSGIPMDYDSFGKNYTFESSGMCEIRAYKDGIPVYVNPKNKPEINLVSNNKSESHSLYYFDTSEKRWVNKGASVVTDLDNAGKAKKLAAQEVNDEREELIKPIKPEKANSKSPFITIAVDPGSIKELLVYDNLKFQLDDKDKNFNPTDTDEEWKTVELQKGNLADLYQIKFTNAKRTVSYLVRPVFEGRDYERALKVFDKKNKEYRNRLTKRIAKENAAKERNQKQYLKDSLENDKILSENKRINRINILIDARNKEIERENAITKRENKEISEYIETGRIYRSFQIDGFFIWNCDMPVPEYFLSITATFQDANGNNLDLTNIAVFRRSFNGIFRFSDNKIRSAKDADHVILGICNGRFAYITYEDYRKLEIHPETKEQTFIMTVVSEKENNYEFIKTIVNRQ